MIWDFKNLLSRRLLLWAVISILVGAGMLLFGVPFWRFFGLQAVLWGVMDGVIAGFGLRHAGQHLGHPSDWQSEVQEAARMRKLLWINNALDVVYAAAGTALVILLGNGSVFWHGTGWGVVVQGAFLFAFDLFHAIRVPEPLQLPALPWFTDPRHQSFLFEGGKPAALLVHGFPGTALEIRPIGQPLNEAGWTVRGVCLPGFGPELAEEIDFNNKDWVNFLCGKLKTLRVQDHSPIILVGYSFGGGLALEVAAKEPLDGLILLAPFTWREPVWATPLLDTVRSLLPVSIDPFRYITIDNPLIQEEFLQYLPEINPEDPEQAGELKYMKIPLYVLDQLRSVGRQALAAAPKVTAPTLIIQGAQDQFVRPENIAYLRAQMIAPVTVEEVNGPHSMTMPHNPTLKDVQAKVVAFAAQILDQNYK
jgi:carboxylesterase